MVPQWQLTKRLIITIVRKICVIPTSPKAPLPMMVKSSKSSTHILCLLSRINSVSLRSKSLIRLICSSSGTSEEANFLSNTHLLQWGKKKKKNTNIGYHLSNWNFASQFLIFLLGQVIFDWFKLRPIPINGQPQSQTTSIAAIQRVEPKLSGSLILNFFSFFGLVS